MFNKLTIKQQQGLAIVLLVIVATTIIFLIVLPLVSTFYDKKNEIEKLTYQLERYDNKISSRKEVNEQALLIREKIKNAAVFGTQNTVPLALADMQQKIKTVISQAKGELISTQNLNQKQEQDEFIKIGINIRFSGRIETLRNILYEFESARPVMMIENIKITGVRGLRNISTGKIDPIDKVDVSVDVISFMPISSP